MFMQQLGQMAENTESPSGANSNTHGKVLSKLCRICSEPALKSPGSKHKFAPQFKSFFGVDITCEDTAIFPQLLCGRHLALMYRVKKAQEKNRSIATTTQLETFMPHNSNCQLCQKFSHPDKFESPVKRQKTEAITTYRWPKYHGQSSSLLEESTKLLSQEKIDMIIGLVKSLQEDQHGKPCSSMASVDGDQCSDSDHCSVEQDLALEVEFPSQQEPIQHPKVTDETPPIPATIVANPSWYRVQDRNDSRKQNEARRKRYERRTRTIIKSLTELENCTDWEGVLVLKNKSTGAVTYGGAPSLVEKFEAGQPLVDTAVLSDRAKTSKVHLRRVMNRK